MNVKVSIASKLILSANLAELARPIGKDRGKTLVNEIGVLSFSRAIVASANEPPPGQLIVSGSIEAKSALFRWKLLALTPDQLSSSHKRVVDRPSQGLPAQRGVNAIKVRQEVRARGAIATRIRGPEINIG